jgi:CO/xanthine dehydrogenase Mo-binding subunit
MMLSRRSVIRTMAGIGGGMILGFHVPGAVAAVVAPKPWTTPTDGVEINAWLAIDADGTVTIRVPHTEQGQGALTSVEMLIAEELDVPWNSIQGVERNDVTARQSTLTAGNRSASYAEFATAAAEIALSQEPAIKTPASRPDRRPRLR